MLVEENPVGIDVFLSYSNDDREAAAAIARGLESNGYRVWWDVDIPAGVHYPKFIEAALKSAACVVVIWSQRSTLSRWVRNEADWGAENESLVPVIIDDAEIPWEFRNIQTLSLAGWKGDPSAPAFLKLVQGVERLAAGAERLRIPSPETMKAAEAAPTAPPDRRSRLRFGLGLRPLPALVLILAVVLVVVLGIRLSGHDADRRDAADASALSMSPLTGDGHTLGAAISPDGRYVIYVPTRNGRASLRLKQLDTGSENVLVEENAQDIRSPVFSPDGVYVYYALAGPASGQAGNATHDLYRISMLGGTPQKIAAGIVGRRFDCSPDGKQLVFKRLAGERVRILVAGADGSGEKEIADETLGTSIHSCLAWLASGAEVASTVRDSVSGFLAIVAYPVAGGPARRLGGGSWQAVLDVRRLAGDPGLLIAGCPESESRSPRSGLWYLRPDRDGPEQITNDVNQYIQVSPAASGGALVASYYSTKRILHVLEPRSAARGRDVTTDVVANGRVVWSEPGRLLVNQRIGNRIGLAYLGSGGDVAIPVLTDAGYVTDMDVMRGSDRLVYSTVDGTDLAIWIANRDGSAPVRLTGPGANEQSPSLSPDGRWLVAIHQETAGAPWVLRRRSLTDSTAIRLSQLDARSPRVSPDGSRVAALVFNAASGRHEWAVVPSDGGDPVFPTVPPGLQPLGWSPGGRGFTCYGRGDAAFEIYDLPLEGGEARRLASLSSEANRITDAAWNADGDSLALCLEMTTYDVLLARGFRP